MTSVDDLLADLLGDDDDLQEPPTEPASGAAQAAVPQEAQDRKQDAQVRMRARVRARTTCTGAQTGTETCQVACQSRPEQSASCPACLCSHTQGTREPTAHSPASPGPSLATQQPAASSSSATASSTAYPPATHGLNVTNAQDDRQGPAHKTYTVAATHSTLVPNTEAEAGPSGTGIQEAAGMPVAQQAGAADTQQTEAVAMQGVGGDEGDSDLLDLEGFDLDVFQPPSRPITPLPGKPADTAPTPTNSATNLAGPARPVLDVTDTQQGPQGLGSVGGTPEASPRPDSIAETDDLTELPELRSHTDATRRGPPPTLQPQPSANYPPSPVQSRLQGSFSRGGPGAGGISRAQSTRLSTLPSLAIHEMLLSEAEEAEQSLLTGE